MKPKIQTAILFFLTAVFAVSAFMLVRQMTSYRAGDEAYAVYVTNASGTHAYSIYAAYEAALDGTAYYSAFSDETIKKAFIDEGVSLSVIRTGAVPTVNDHILTLSTCTGNGHATRWVVQAVME